MESVINKDTKTLVITAEFDAGRDMVWRALTERDLMRQWYFDLAEFRAEVGFKFEFWAGDDHGKRWKHLCEVTDVEPETKIGYTWKYDGYSGISHVLFELFDAKGGTLLKLTHSGIDTFPADVPELALHNFETGWNHIIDNSLKNFLEKK